MPIGAVVGATAVGVGGSVLGANAQKKAANKAADTSLQVAETNNALQRDIYGQNQSALSPYMQRGNAAGDQINALLGLQTATPTPTATGTPGGPDYAAYVNANSDISKEWQRIQNEGRFTNQADFGKFHYNTWGQGENRSLPTSGNTGYGGGWSAGPAGSPNTTPAANAQAAFDTFRNSTGYQFRLGQGTDAINTGYAANGLLQSGAAQKALTRYGQDYASGEFGNYIGHLANQQGVGLGGASALAGVGQNYANSVSANNNSAGTAAANAALIKGNANANMYGSIAGSIGNVFGSSFGF